MDGLLIIDKPVGPTSHEVVARVRRALGERRIGHTGTLDPLASGVLPLVLGRATRLARFLSASDKTYDARIRLGVATTTYDADGTPVGAPYEGPVPARDAIERALDDFRGTFLQQPPIYSAKKVDGRRSYKNARAQAKHGTLPALPASPAPAAPAPVAVTTHSVDVVSLDADVVRVRVHCSAGFYVRSLAHDLGQRLGTGAHLIALRRTASGDISLDEAIALDAIERDPAVAAGAVVPLSGMLPGLTAVTLTDEGARRAAHGCDLGPGDLEKEGRSPIAGGTATTTPDPFFRLVDPAGNLVAIATPREPPGLLHPAVVLV
jgi:tRNA pseudouridine55 synthase